VNTLQTLMDKVYEIDTYCHVL